MTSRVALLVLLALAACKKKDTDAAANSDPTLNGGPTGGTRPDTETPTRSAGGKHVDWQKQTGPGFTVVAPGAATISKVASHDGDPAFERYTFYTTKLESYVVEIIDVPPKGDVGMALNNLRMRITSTTQSVRNEDYIEGGEVTGRDIRYIVDQDDDTLHARSKLVGKGQKIFQVRAVTPEDKAIEAEGDRFVDSFEFAP